MHKWHGRGQVAEDIEDLRTPPNIFHVQTTGIRAADLIDLLAEGPRPWLGGIIGVLGRPFL